MASMLIHLAAAYRLQQEGGLLHDLIKDPASYYLGVAAPDSVNLDGFASKEIRWEAHQRAQTPKGWYVRAGAFYHRLKEEHFPDQDLLLGYLVHILTDAAFDETFHDPIWVSAAIRSGGKLSRQDAGWAECDRFDQSQLSESWWLDTVRPALTAAKPVAIGPISEELLCRQQKYLLERFSRRVDDTPAQIITQELIWTLGDYVGSVMESMIK